MAADALRLLNKADAQKAVAPSQAESFLAPTPAATVGDEDYRRMLRSGVPLQGIQVRDDVSAPPQRDHYFEGTFKRTHHVYVGRDVVTYDKGVYAMPGQAAYVGTFNYFGQPTQTDVAFVFPKSSFVVVGKKLTPDGKAETGIYIAEDAVAGLALRFVKATPEYLADFERRHLRAAEAYRRQQAEQAASGGFDFGQALALGLGAAVIGSADLPGLDKMQLGQAFVSDVLGNGDGSALMSSFMGALQSAPGQGASGGGALFSGGMDFQAPGLNGMLAALMPGAAPAGSGAAVHAPAAAPTMAGSAAPAGGSGGGTARSETYSFSCPSGASYAIPVSYRNASCGAAMKNFARVYSCNLIGDFAAAGQRCQQACGNAQCAEQ
ncbi:MAG: hypothetical protein Kow00114_17120 [Kiloniellaceae bacterium]